ncbi:YdbL family protein [Hyphomonas sp. WL0036]|uniref:YdbL family protein n=1 Tax=Hyphomonas sediminis TaxID=2866160 RepID=UPI001C7F8F12|nr:YdbL family protein [Hyphomonas sediminis]MBY9065407.1 YdbL family protein [Hyphomonas sediminis]
MTIFRTLILSLVLVFGGLAYAQGGGDPQIEAARSSGVIGERIDGYLGVVSSADADVTRKVQDINNRRRALYEKTASETGTTVQQVARIAGEKQLAQRVKAGEYYMDESGTWKQK